MTTTGELLRTRHAVNSFWSSINQNSRPPIPTKFEATRYYTASPALNKAIRADQLTPAVRRWIQRIDPAMTPTTITIRATRVIDASTTYAAWGVHSPQDVGRLAGELIEEDGSYQPASHRRRLQISCGA